MKGKCFFFRNIGKYFNNFTVSLLIIRRDNRKVWGGKNLVVSTVCFVIEWQTKPTLIGLLIRAHKEAALATVLYGIPEGAFLFQYLPEKKSKQKELERKSKQ